MSALYTGKKSPELLDYLLKRRSAKAADMRTPGPDKAQLESMLHAAMRVPDHGKTAPFYFLVFEGDARKAAGEVIVSAFKRDNPDADADKIIEQAGRFMRAPLVIGVIYRARKAKHPLWEQMMSVGAACQNLILAANALGFAAQWLSEWYAYDEDVRTAFGLDGRDVVAGFIHIGTPPEGVQEERERPELADLMTYWSPEVSVSKGDQKYDRDKFDLPRPGFSIKEE